YLSVGGKGRAGPPEAARYAEGILDRIERRGDRGQAAQWAHQAQPAVSPGGLRCRLRDVLGRFDRHDLLMPLAGAAIGAASGALGGALADVGINDQFMKDAAQNLQAGNAALFLLIRKTTNKVLAALQGEGGTVARTSFDESKEGALRQALAGASAGSGAPPASV